MFDREDVTDVVGDDAYLDDLEKLEQQDFPHYTPEDVLELNRARYVEEEARSQGEDAYADAVHKVRERFFDPLENFDMKSMRYGESDEDFLDALTDREKTFLHYPAPPNHLLPAAEGGGMGVVHHELSQSKLDAMEQDEFLKGQVRLKAVGEGAKQVARESYQDMVEHWDETSEEFDAGFDYDSVEEYADAVAYNITLAAERMFEVNGNDFNLDYGP